MSEVQGENYRIWFDNNSQTIYFKGSLRLAGMSEYAPILQLLQQITTQASSPVKLNLQDLELLNSSGINMFSKFIIDMRKQPEFKMSIIASEGIPWQSKSLKNLQRLMPSLELNYQ